MRRVGHDDAVDRDRHRARSGRWVRCRRAGRRPATARRASTRSGAPPSTVIVDRADVADGRRSRPAGAASRGRSARRRRARMQLARRPAPIGDPPRRRRVAVDGHARPVLGPVGERLAVRRRPWPAPDRPGTATVGRRRRRRSANTGRRSSAGRRGADVRRAGSSSSVKPDDVLRAAPVVGPVAVGVGHDELVGPSTSASPARRPQRGACSGRSSSPSSSPAAAASTSPSPLPATTTTSSLARMTGTGSSTGTSSTGGDRSPTRRVGERLLVDHRDVGLVRPPARRRPTGPPRPAAPPANRSSASSGPRRAEAVEGGVAGQPDRVGAEQAGDRGDGVRLERRRTGSGRRGRTAGPSPPAAERAAGRG